MNWVQEGSGFDSGGNCQILTPIRPSPVVRTHMDMLPEISQVQVHIDHCEPERLTAVNENKMFPYSDKTSRTFPPPLAWSSASHFGTPALAAAGVGGSIRFGCNTSYLCSNILSSDPTYWDMQVSLRVLWRISLTLHQEQGELSRPQDKAYDYQAIKNNYGLFFSTAFPFRWLSICGREKILSFHLRNTVTWESKE